VPQDVAERPVIIVDPMLATANSAVAAVDRVKQSGVTDIKLACLLAAPEGVERMNQAHPDVTIYTASLDQGLNDHGYILPGLGDAGDRIYGTR
jgi:uracil phosphoribosyltransferase